GPQASPVTARPPARKPTQHRGRRAKHPGPGLAPRPDGVAHTVHVTESALPHTRPDLDALPAYVPGRSSPGAIKLASNETTAGPLPGVARAIADAASRANRYPDSGARELTARLADLAGTAPENVAVGCGSVSLCQ